MAAQTVLSLLQEKVCSYSRGSASVAFLNVAHPENKANGTVKIQTLQILLVMQYIILLDVKNIQYWPISA